MKRFTARTLLTLGVALVLTACGSGETQLQTNGSAYIRDNISTLSPRKAKLGGQFRVTAIEWVDEDTALVTYEDGQTKFRGRTDVMLKGSAATATRLRLENNNSDDDTNSSSSSSGSFDASASSTSLMSASATSMSRASAMSASAGTNGSTSSW